LEVRRRLFFSRFSSSCFFAEGVHITNNVYLSPNIYCNRNVSIIAKSYAPVQIGRNTVLSPNVSVVSVALDTLTIGAERSHYGRSIHIGSNVWLATGVLVLAGSIIEDDCVIGVGNIIKGFVKKGSVIPARVSKL